jgi:hypothetical protein
MGRGVVLAALGCVLSATVSAQDAAKGAALLAQARQAVGGEDRLAAVKTLDVRGPFKRSAGQSTIEGELQLRLERPDKLRRDEDMSPPGGGPAIVRTEVLNGNEIWEENPAGRGAGRFVMRGGGDRGGAADRPSIDPAQIAEVQRRARQADLTRLLVAWLLTADAPVAWVGIAEAPDGRADVLEITPTGQPAMRLFLDEKTHLPLMLTWQGMGPQMFVRGRGDGTGARGPGRGARAAEATLRMTFGDYKTVNGLRFPHLITRGTSEQTVEEWTIDSYRVNPSFRSNVFTK